MILQQLVEVGNLKISDSLLDANNVVMQVRTHVTVLCSSFCMGEGVDRSLFLNAQSTAKVISSGVTGWLSG